MAYTVAQVMDLIRKRCTLENTTHQVNTEILSHINEAARQAHDFYIATFGEHYDVLSVTLPTVAGQGGYDIPVNPVSGTLDFLYLSNVKLLHDSEYWPLEPFSNYDQILQTQSMPWAATDRPKYLYRKSSTGHTIIFDPPPDSVYQVRIEYHPEAPVYAEGDTINLPYPELLITIACILVKLKERQDGSFFVAERQMIEKRIEDRVSSLDTGAPARTLRAGGRRSTSRRVPHV